MNRREAFVLALAATAMMAPQTAMAYIGPGVTGGAIAAVIGVIGSIFLAIVGVLYYPIKRMLKNRKRAAKSSGDGKPTA